MCVRPYKEGVLSFQRRVLLAAGCGASVVGMAVGALTM